jgi:hypothetical protein
LQQVSLNLELTPERIEIIHQLQERPWYQATSPFLQLELMTLPQSGRENHDGFLQDLVARPEEMGGITVLHLERLSRGNFGLVPIFRVRNAAGTEYTYEYFSWRYGSESGAKGIVFVENNGQLTHFIILRGEKFATGKLEWDLVGGFADLNVDGVSALMQRIAVEVKEELGLPELTIKRVVDFGPHLVDAGQTNNRPVLFAAVIDGSEAEHLSSQPVNPDQFELRSGPVIFPISQLLELVKEIQDGMYRSAAILAIAHGLIDLRNQA